jgi:rRNA-processing protein FCF1
VAVVAVVPNIGAKRRIAAARHAARLAGMGKKTKPLTPSIVSAYLAEIGRKGGQKSRRTLTTEQAKAMRAKREEKRKARAAERPAKPPA